MHKQYIHLKSNGCILNIIYFHGHLTHYGIHSLSYNIKKYKTFLFQQILSQNVVHLKSICTSTNSYIYVTTFGQ